MSAHKEEPAGHAAPKGGGLISKLVPALIVIAVVTGEGVAAFMLMPSVEDNAKAAREALAAKPPEPEYHDEHDAELAEIDLEEYKITSFQPASSITLRIEFHLFGMVPAEKAEEFKHIYEAKKNRVRDNVMAIIRSAEMNDLTDPGLGLIKRKILETTNKALGKPLLEGVMFAEFTFLEQ
ncbi:MAG: flagellar basal body-associated FliL family protein [Planctomycetaceae bacterium]|nr:flagellar basal body-associated FliL family protein [Planctomycetaceae bacterium]